MFFFFLCPKWVTKQRLQAETQRKVLAEYHTESHGEHFNSTYSSCVRITEAIFFFWFSVVFSPYSESSNCSKKIHYVIMKLKTALQCTQESNNGCMGNGVTGISQLWSAWLCSLNSITFVCLFKGKNEFCYLSLQQKLSDRTSWAALETLTCSSAFLWATQ